MGSRPDTAVRVPADSTRLQESPLSMPPLATVNVPTPSGNLTLTFEAGHSTIFVGANGAGKTRLGVFFEEMLQPTVVRRVAAHRSLNLNDDMSAISLERALRGLETGHTGGGNRHSHRWQGKPATAMLSDYVLLLQALFAEQNRTAIAHLGRHKADPNAEPPATLLSRLKAVWERLLPHRSLLLLELGIEVLSPGIPAGQGYSGSDMSDGERVMFYLLGHALLAPRNGIMIIDEPELHIHKAILARLWDAVESERPDCSFIYITHDLDFVVARPTAAKYGVASFRGGSSPKWEIESLPIDDRLPERIISELIGSRQPVLFVEGDRASLDSTIYRYVYSDFLVHPVGSCDDVIHAIATFKRHPSLHRIGAVRGCVDADGRDQNDIESLSTLNVSVLPVAEIENCLLLRDAFYAIALALHHTAADAEVLNEKLASSIIRKAKLDLEAASVRYAVRRLDASLKRIGPSAATASELSRKFQEAVASLDPEELAKSYRTKLTAAVECNDIAAVLALYDNKGLLSDGAALLGLKSRSDLTELVGRLLGSNTSADLLSILKRSLPQINPH